MGRRKLNSFNIGQPSPKKNKTGVLPWKENGLIPESVDRKNTTSCLKYALNLYSDSELLKHENISKIAMKNQLYSIMEDRTSVDRGINELRESGEIKMFKTSYGFDQYCVMFTTDYINHILGLYNSNLNNLKTREPIKTPIPKSVLKFVTEIIPVSSNVHVDESLLIQKHKFKDVDITELIKVGVLNVRDAGSWWISIPNAGTFLKMLRKGRQATLQIIKRTKYKELSCKELLQRKKPLNVKFGFLFHIHDLIGADLVKAVDSTSGTILRIL